MRVPKGETTTRFFITARASADQDGSDPQGAFSEDLLRTYMQFNEEMHRARVLLASEGLNPAARGARIARDPQDQRGVCADLELVGVAGDESSPSFARGEVAASPSTSGVHSMLRLFIGNKNYSSWSLRPWILMKELSIPFEEHLVPFGSVDGEPPFKRFSPTGRVPCLIDVDRTVWDSLAITEYLAETDPRVWPVDPGARAWARCAAAEMHSGFHGIRDACTMNCGLRVQVSQWSGAVLQEWKRVDELWCEGLSRYGGPFLAGATFSAVDAFFAPVAFRVQSYAPAITSSASAYAARLLALAHMRAWYAAALEEPWRDEAHEAEARAAGSWLQDLRASFK